ncbi:MAG: methionine adenosyltransferase [Acidobacteria bacterium]|nr:MAG: methionine adenosyltransferase [Acidobacteriota bacterium]
MPDPASRNTQHLFTSESVSDGHPDKICDQISDAILDACLMIDPHARVAVETAVKDHEVILLGEISRGARPDDIEKIVNGVLDDIGHSDGRWGLAINALNITDLLGNQSLEISDSVVGNGADLGAGDQGMMFGYACRETSELMPLPVAMAHGLMRRQRDFRLGEEGKAIGPDAKAQVTAVYQGGIPIGLNTVVLSTQHSPEIAGCDLEELIRELIVRPVVEHYALEMPKRLLVNPSGSFTEGGPIADAGLTGRKIIVDTYGGAGRHGGGAFSGKDATKVDRSAAYAARQLARAVVAAGFAERCETRLAYAIGRSEPVELSLETFETADLPHDEILRQVNPEGPDAFRPARIIKRLNLRRPIFQPTATFGHFGRQEFPWEQ